MTATGHNRPRVGTIEHSAGYRTIAELGARTSPPDRERVRVSTSTPAADPPAATRSQRLVGAAKANVPEGTYAIGGGLLIAALTAYGFQILADRQLDETQYKAVNNLWFLIFIVAPGFFQPLEAEVARAIAARRTRGVGGGPVVRKAARLGAILAACVALVALAASPSWLVPEYFEGEVTLLICLLVALATYYTAHLTRGALSGNKRFGPYGLMYASEGILRIAFVVVVVVIGLNSPGWFALALVVPPALSVLISLQGQRGLLMPGPDAPYSELSTALTLLLVGTALAQALSYAPAVAASLLLDNDRAAAGFITGMFIARIPMLMFQAVQAALLPKLSTYAASGQHADFRAGLRKLLVVVLGVALIGTIGAATVGPSVGRILFDKWTLGNRDLALLAGGAGGFILALTLAQGLIALRGYRQVATAWVIGIAVFLGLMPIAGHDVVLRVQLAFITACWTTAAVVTTLLILRMRVATATLEDLVGVVEHEPLEL